jgi:sugar-specific transcriptional regulator TrmB
MLIPEDYIKILADIGLTHTEAKVYMALLNLQNATARNVHKESKVARQDVYRILSELQEKGLIEKVITKPSQFRPIPPGTAISILTRRQNEQHSQLQEKAKQAFKNFPENSIPMSSHDESSKFILLSKSEANPTGHIDKLGQAVNSAKKNVKSLVTFPLFMKVKLMDEHIWKKAVKRGVKFDLIIGRKPDEKIVLNLDPMLKNTNNFKIRWTPTLPQAAVLLVDDKEAFCRVGHEITNPVLWSADPSFVAMIKDYFKTKWESLGHHPK